MARAFYAQGSIVELRTDWPLGFEAMDGILGARFELSEEPETLDDWTTRTEIASIVVPAELLPEQGLYDGAHYHATVGFEPDGDSMVRAGDDTSFTATLPAERIWDYSAGHGAYEAKISDDDAGVTAFLEVDFPFPDEPWFDEEGDECVVTIELEYDHEMSRERQTHAQSLGTKDDELPSDFFAERRREAQRRLDRTN